MKKPILIIALATLLTGCSGLAQSVVDSNGYTRRVEAVEKTEQERAFAQSQQWLAQGKAAESQARSDEAQAEAAARAAEAQAATDQANALAFASLGKAIQEAGEPNNAPVIVAMLLIVGFAGWAIWNSRQTTIQAIAASRPMLQPPPAVQMLADQQGLRPIHDGQRWLLVDELGKVVQRQKFITG